MADTGELAEDWLRFAREDLDSAAGMLTQRGPHQPRQACFSAQQAAEKAIKAVFVAQQADYLKIHDLADLLVGLGGDYEVARASEDVDWLSQWAVGARYPGEPEPSWGDATRAVEIASHVLVGAEQDVQAAS